MHTRSSFSFFKKTIFAISGLVAVAAFLLPATAGAQAQTPAGPCTITSAQFKPLSNQPSWTDKNGNFFLGANFNGEDGWFQEQNTNIVVSVRTQNCAGTEIGIEVKSNRPEYLDQTIGALQDKKFLIEENSAEGYELALQVGEEYCQDLTNDEIENTKAFPLSVLINDTADDAELRALIGLSNGVFAGDNQDIDVRGELTRYIEYYGSALVGAFIGEDGVDLASYLFAFQRKGDSIAQTIDADIVGPFLNYLYENHKTKTSFPNPCEFYLKITNPDSVNGDKDFSTLTSTPKQILRYSCDGDLKAPGFSICEQDVTWKLLQQNSNIGGLMPIDPSNPCYDPNAANLRKADCQELLAPLPGFGDRVDENLGLGEYINTLLQMVIGFMGIIAVLMIIAAGVKYMTTENFGGKADAKATITNAFLGLLIAVSIFIILRTINPDLLNLDVGIENVEIGQQDPDVPAGYTVDYNVNTGVINKYELPSDLKTTLGLYCPGSGGSSEINEIATSFNNKTTYRFGGKGGHIPSNWSWQGSSENPNAMCEDNRMCRTFCPSGTICLDCSGYVSHVLQCAGMTGGNLSGTSAIFSNGDWESIKNNTTDLSNNTINGRELTPGDLIGGRKWHVVIYIGNGQVAESSSDASGRLKNQGVKISDLESRVSSNNKFKYVRFMSS